MTLDSELKRIVHRADRFKELKEAASRGENIERESPEYNDLAALKVGAYSEVKIPPDLVEEAKSLLNMRKRDILFYQRCELVERRLHKILSDYKVEHPEA